MSLQLLFERGIGSIHDLPERWLMVAGVVTVFVALAIALLTIARIRLSRKLKAIDAVVAELQAEVDRLRQAEERRALSDLRANRAFLQNLALELTDNNPATMATMDEADKPAESSERAREPARLKLSSAG
jgi:hypothetical protein